MLCAQGEHHRLELGAGLSRTALRASRAVGEPGQTLRLVASEQPVAGVGDDAESAAQLAPVGAGLQREQHELFTQRHHRPLPKRHDGSSPRSPVARVCKCPICLRTGVRYLPGLNTWKAGDFVPPPPSGRNAGVRESGAGRWTASPATRPDAPSGCRAGGVGAKPPRIRRVGGWGTTAARGATLRHARRGGGGCAVARRAGGRRP